MERAQKREYYRLEASSTPDWVRLLGPRDTVIDAVDARILDVSATGLRLHVPHGVMTPETRLEVRFHVGDQAFSARGTVMWVEVSEFTKTQLAGVLFDDNPLVRQRLVRAIYDQQRDQLRRRTV